MYFGIFVVVVFVVMVGIFFFVSLIIFGYFGGGGVKFLFIGFYFDFDLNFFVDVGKGGNLSVFEFCGLG